MRLFVAIIPPRSILDHLERALTSVSGTSTLSPPWLPRSCWHITLAFYGEVPSGLVPALADEVRLCARPFSPLAVHLQGAGAFRERVAWIGTGGQSLTPLMKAMVAVREQATADGDRKRNRAHLTVARSVRDDRVADMVRSLSVYRGPTWTVDRVHLVQSHLGAGEHRHPRYDILETFPVAFRDKSGTDPDVPATPPARWWSHDT